MFFDRSTEGQPSHEEANEVPSALAAERTEQPKTPLQAYQSRYEAAPVLHTGKEIEALGLRLPEDVREQLEGPAERSGVVESGLDRRRSRDAGRTDAFDLAARRFAVNAENPSAAYQQLTEKERGLQARRAELQKQYVDLIAAVPKGLQAVMPKTAPEMAIRLLDEEWTKRFEESAESVQRTFTRLEGSAQAGEAATDRFYDDVVALADADKDLSEVVKVLQTAKEYVARRLTKSEAERLAQVREQLGLSPDKDQPTRKAA